MENYEKPNPSKDSFRYGEQQHDELIISDSTPIRDKKAFIANRKTKDGLTLYLARKIAKLSKKPMIVASRKDIQTNGLFPSRALTALLSAHRKKLIR